MKPLLLLYAFFLLQTTFAQSLDYISIRKKNGEVIKNFYAGSDILLQTTEGGYLQGPVKTVRNDSVFVILYDIRYYSTTWGTYVKDTISTTVVGIRYDEISRVHLKRSKSFFQRSVPPLLMIGGAGYVVLNVLNGGIDGQSVTGSQNLKRLETAAGVFGAGFLLHKLFSSDGFSKRTNKVVYVNLTPNP